jgi:hypothetical protein
LELVVLLELLTVQMVVKAQIQHFPQLPPLVAVAATIAEMVFQVVQEVELAMPTLHLPEELELPDRDSLEEMLLLQLAQLELRLVAVERGPLAVTSRT